MLNSHDTSRLLRELSAASDPVARARRVLALLPGAAGVRRLLMLGREGLRAPAYRLLLRADTGGRGLDRPDPPDLARAGGLLGELCYAASMQTISPLPPARSDPAHDLLAGFGSLVAMPLFERGQSAGAAVFLRLSRARIGEANLRLLAVMSALLPPPPAVPARDQRPAVHPRPPPARPRGPRSTPPDHPRSN